MMFASEDALSPGSAIEPLISSKTDGCVYAIGILDSFIVVAVNTAVSQPFHLPISSVIEMNTRFLCTESIRKRMPRV